MNLPNRLFVGACVAPSTGIAGWSLPLSLALLAEENTGLSMGIYMDV
jgi:hypothetical protein